MLVDAVDHPLMAGGFGVPSSARGVVARDVVELGLEGWAELGGGDEVVALLADVGVGAGVGDEVPGAVAVRGAMTRALRVRTLPMAAS